MNDVCHAIIHAVLEQKSRSDTKLQMECSPNGLHRALLQRMAPEHKFATAAKLCGEVLGGVADGLLPLGQCEEVLGDALRCLASKDIKVTVEILSTLSTRA